MTRSRKRSPGNSTARRWPTCTIRRMRPSCWSRRASSSPAFAQLRDDGSTTSGCWIFAGSWTQAGNQMGRRDNSDPTGIGQTLGWAWAWPANRRVLYNRASCDLKGKPFDPTRKLIEWNGTQLDRRRHSRLQGRRDRPKTAWVRSSCWPRAWRVSLRAARWPKGRSPNITSRSKIRSATTRCIRKTRRRPAIRPRACSPMTGRCSARMRSIRMWPPATA